MTVTTIQIKTDTLERLKKMKVYSRESYDEVINNILDNDEVEVLTEKDIKEIEEGLADVKAGRTYSEKEIAKEFGVKLEY
tara:strand:- start:160 stop:399 length:240 start_codon:yes stop_codon:yes gene_type:complete